MLGLLYRSIKTIVINKFQNNQISIKLNRNISKEITRKTLMDLGVLRATLISIVFS